MKHFFKQAAAMTAASALIASAVPFSASAAGESYTKSKQVRPAMAMTLSCGTKMRQET